MAKSKTGGSRAYIRGRIGSDVYSIGKNAQGARQQVVRSLAEQVSNPRTQSQMFGRMVMSTVMQAVSALRPIIDHSFDGLPSGQPSISEFIKLNYALIAADAKAHPASGNVYGLNKFQEKGIKVGQYQVSKGEATIPEIVTNNMSALHFQLTEAAHTVGDLRTALGLASEGYVTYLAIDGDGKVWTFRAHVKDSLADSTEITAANASTIFDIEGNVTVTAGFDLNDLSLSVSIDDPASAYGTIISDKKNGQWVHNTCVLSGAASAEFASDVALPTYPVGSEQYLNGGDL